MQSHVFISTRLPFGQPLPMKFIISSKLHTVKSFMYVLNFLCAVWCSTWKLLVFVASHSAELNAKEIFVSNKFISLQILHLFLRNTHDSLLNEDALKNCTISEKSMHIYICIDKIHIQEAYIPKLKHSEINIEFIVDVRAYVHKVSRLQIIWK